MQVQEILANESGYEKLFRQWYQPLCRMAYRITADKEACEDIVQEVFVKLWERRDTLDIKISLKAYLYRATINASINFQKMNQRFAKFDPVDPVKDYSSSAPDSQEQVQAQELQKDIHEAIESLPPACKNVFLMSRYEELSYKEIAEALNISIKTVENQMGKALKIMRDKLSNHLIILVLILECINIWFGA